ncbi:hypothetical protein [Parasphingorhabdus halotolerans]|nr:hypothetical protein [Parasphingorhabdus halotolerans]
MTIAPLLAIGAGLQLAPHPGEAVAASRSALDGAFREEVETAN